MTLKNKFIYISIFAVSMAFLESAVVIYLREILYPEGFSFPLTPMKDNLVITELLRELATLLMLVSIGILAGINFSTGFAWFLYSFAVWDIFYYVFLWLLIAWPESLFTWDILFLIPTTWTGPVISPVLVSDLMIPFAVIILSLSAKRRETKIRRMEWIMLVLGSLILILAFTFDYSRYILSHHSFFDLFKAGNEEVMKTAYNYIPESFPWWIFFSGFLIISAAIFIYRKRITRQ